MIAQYFPPDMGGGATRAYNVVKGLLLNGCDVTVIAAFPHYPDGNIPRRFRWKAFKKENYKGVNVIRTFVPPIASRGITRRLILFTSFVVSALFMLFIVGNFDVIWAANPNILSMFPAKIYGWLRKRPVAMNIDDLWTGSILGRRENSLFIRTIDLLSRIVYSQADIITPISPGYVDAIHDKYNVNFEKIHVVRGGVDLNTFRVDDHPLNRDSFFRVLYIGAFSVAYDFNQILLAAKALENVCGVEFVLQGGGELLEYVEKRTESLGLSNVKVINKIVSREEVARTLHNADVLILPLKQFNEPYGGISTKIYEYQAAGRPIICCSEGTSEKYVSDTRSGVSISPGDYKGLAKNILYLKNNPVFSQELGENGKKYVEENLSIERIGHAMKQLLSNLL